MPYGQVNTYNAMGSSASQYERDFMQRNQGYQDTYGAMDARSGQIRQSMTMSAQSNNRRDNTHSMNIAQQQNRDEIDIRPRKSKNRSRSPLRTQPAEVFSRSPRAQRHYEDGPADSHRDGLSSRGGGAASNRMPSPTASGRMPSPRHIDEDRPQQQASHMSAHP